MGASIDAQTVEVLAFRLLGWTNRGDHRSVREADKGHIADLAREGHFLMLRFGLQSNTLPRRSRTMRASNPLLWPKAPAIWSQTAPGRDFRSAGPSLNRMRTLMDCRELHMRRKSSFRSTHQNRGKGMSPDVQSLIKAQRDCSARQSDGVTWLP
jgi:hypothetical protein